MHNARPRRSAESACLLNNFYGRSKAENGRTKLIVLGQIVHTIFKCNFIHCLDDPPNYPFFRGYKKRTEQEGTPKKNACDVDRHQAGISPGKRLNMRSKLIDQLGKCVNLLEKGALSQDEYISRAAKQHYV